MNQTTEPVRTKYTSCPLCGVFKVSDGYNYGEQTCACGFGRRPTEEEIENDQFSISQVHNMLVDLFRLEQRVEELEKAAKVIVDEAHPPYGGYCAGVRGDSIAFLRAALTPGGEKDE